MPEWDYSDLGLKIDGATGTLTDISAYVNNQSLQAALTVLETTGVGQANKTRKQGLADRQISLNGFLNSTTEAIFGPLLNHTSTTKTIEYKAKSNRFYNGEFVISNVQFSGAPDTLQLWSLTAVNTGVLNRTSVATA